MRRLMKRRHELHTQFRRKMRGGELAAVTIDRRNPRCPVDGAR